MRIPAQPVLQNRRDDRRGEKRDDHNHDDRVVDDHIGDDHVVGFLLRQFDKIEEQIEEERNKISQQMNSAKTELEANCKAAAKEVVAFEDPFFAVK